eukprot:2112-Eustigmatos_ZCMA.PRE.1
MIQRRYEANMAKLETQRQQKQAEEQLSCHAQSVVLHRPRTVTTAMSITKTSAPKAAVSPFR